jgi:hypothetical protein
MKKIIFSLLISGIISTGCNKKNAQSIRLTDQVPTDQNAPPKTWQEHWFDHVQLLDLVHYGPQVAVYYDKDMSREVTWPFRTAAAIWQYTKARYGSFGNDERLFVVLHIGKYGGGHPSTYYDNSHDYRNTIDIGSNSPWKDSTGWNLDIVSHEVGHIVEGASKGIKRSPAFPIWHDSKWMEIYQYDVYKGLGWDAEATRWYNLVVNGTENYPRTGTQWFKNWFYPIYRDYGGINVLNGFFTTLATHFPKKTISGGNEYTRDMNLGEFVHFWSGAAKTNLKQLALDAFGPKDEQGNDWVKQFESAQLTFGNITY